MNQDIKKRFRLCAKNIFLTYPQCPLSKEEVLEQLKENFRSYSVKSYLIASEEHDITKKRISELEKTNHLYGRHIHVLLCLNKRIDLIGTTKLDLKGPPEKPIIHGHYETARSKAIVQEYLKKGGDSLSTFEENFDQKVLAISQAEGIDAALEFILVHKPLCNILRYEKALLRVQKLRTFKTKKADFKLENFQYDEIPQLKEYILLGRTKLKDKSLIIYGPSGIGKTQGVLAMLESCNKVPLVISQIDDLKQFRKDFHTCYFFDDTGLTHISLEKRRLLMDRSRPHSIGARYQDVIIEPDPLRIYITTNLYKVLGEPGSRRESKLKSVFNRIIQVEVKNSLIKSEIINIQNNT
jgi:hypothetical protein